MNRRAFLGTMTGGLLTAPLTAGPQQAAKVYRLGVLSLGSSSSGDIGREAFVQRLRELGWSVGNNVMFEARYAEGQVDRLPGLAAELAQLKVSVILAFGTPASLKRVDILTLPAYQKVSDARSLAARPVPRERGAPADPSGLP